MKVKIVILILSTKDFRYIDFINNCNDSWVTKMRENGLRCIFYSGGAAHDKLENDHLELNCDDSLAGTAFKLFRALKFIENSDIDYTHIFRTNLSSFIFVDSFLLYCRSLRTTFYGGVIGKFNKITILNRFHFISILSSKFLKFQTFEYASGSGFFISKDLVTFLINKKDLQFNFIDDVMVGFALLGQEITFIPRFDISDDFEYRKFDEDCYHVRLKSSDRIIDAKRMLLLNNYLDLSSFIDSEF